MMGSCYISPAIKGIPISNKNTPGCPKGFYCPEALSKGLVSETCPSTRECTSLRLRGIQCKPQGSLEPMLCPAGYLCKNGLNKMKCPRGHFCPSGSYRARDCSFMSLCGEGSLGPTNFLGALICVAIDIVIVILLVYNNRIHVKNARKFGFLSRWRIQDKVGAKDDTTSIPVTKRIEEKLRRSLPKRPRGVAKINSNFDDDTFVVVSNLDLSGKVSSGELKEYLESIDDPDKDSEAILNRIRSKHKSRDLDDSASEVKSSFEIAIPVSESIHKLANIYNKFRGPNTLSTSLGFEDVRITGECGAFGKYTGSFRSGVLSAVIGGREAYENELIEVLSGMKRKHSGDIKLNNKITEVKELRYSSGYIGENPSFISNLSVRENILYSAHVKRPSNANNADTKMLVTCVIDALGLDPISDVITTETEGQCLSVSQRMRLAIAMELVALPEILFFINPITGMDHVSAQDLVRILKNLTTMGLTIIGTFNHISNQALRLFDDVAVVGSGGEIVYLGPQNEIQKYFEKLGFQFPEYTNFATEMVEIGSGNGPTQMRQALSPAQLVTCWESYSGYSDMEPRSFSNYPDIHKSNPPPSESEHESKSSRPSILKRFSYLFHNSTLRNYRKQHNKIPINKQGPSWIHKAWIYQKITILQLFNSPERVTWDLILSTFFGLTLGFMVSNRKKELLMGLYIDSLEPLSTSVNYWILSLVSMTVSVFMSVVGSVSGTDEFLKDADVIKVEYNRVRYSLVGYFIANTFVSLFRAALSSLHFVSFFLLLGKQPISLVDDYAIVMLQTMGLFFISSILGILWGTGRISLYYTVTINLFSAIIPGLNTLTSTRMNGIYMYIYLTLNPNFWAMEAFFSRYAQVYSNVYKFDSSNTFGLNVHRFSLNLIYIAAIALTVRIFTFAILKVNLTRHNRF